MSDDRTRPDGEPRYCTCEANGIELPARHAKDCRMSKSAASAPSAGLVERLIHAAEVLERGQIKWTLGIAGRMREAADTLDAQAQTLARVEAERDEERAMRISEVEHWVQRYNELEAWRIQTAQSLARVEREQAEGCPSCKAVLDTLEATEAQLTACQREHKTLTVMLPPLHAKIAELKSALAEAQRRKDK